MMFDVKLAAGFIGLDLWTVMGVGLQQIIMRYELQPVLYRIGFNCRIRERGFCHRLTDGLGIPTSTSVQYVCTLYRTYKISLQGLLEL